MRVLMDGPEEYQAGEVFVCGDTIALTAMYLDTDPYPAVCLSADNGNTWSPWRILGDLGQALHDNSAQVIYTSDAIYCCAQTEQYRAGLYRTTNMGQSWQDPPADIYILQYYGARRGDTLFFKAYGDSVAWTADGGQTFAPLRDVGLDSSATIRGMSASEGWLHVISNSYDRQQLRTRLRYARAPLTDGPFEPMRYINDDIFWANTSRIEFSDDGVGMILTAMEYAPPSPTYSAILVNISRDDGQSWSPPDTFTPFESASYVSDGIVHLDHMWLAYWYDSTRQAGFEHGGAWCRLSANHGRSWYPNQQIEGAGWGWGALIEAEITHQRARIYASCLRLNGVPGNYFLQWEGELSDDESLPLLYDGTMFPEQMPGDTAIEFAAAGEDNDSLWNVATVFRRSGSHDSMVVPLEREFEINYRGTWTVPPDTAEWLYYYRAEDMWENVSFLPPEGPADPWRFHVGPLSSSDDLIIPSSLSLSVFPNPFNATTTLTFSLPHSSSVTLSIFNLLGQSVYENDLGRLEAGEHRHIFDASALPSGVYVARVSAEGMSQMRKMVLMK